MGCAASNPTVLDDLLDVTHGTQEISQVSKQNVAPHPYQDSKLAKLLSTSRHGGEGKTSDSRIPDSTELAIVSQGENSGKTGDKTNHAKEKLKLKRSSSEEESFFASTSVDDIALERGRSVDIRHGWRSPGGLLSKRSRSVDSRSGSLSFRANFKPRSGEETPKSKEREDSMGRKHGKEVWDSKGKVPSSRDLKRKGDPRTEQGGSLMSKIKYSTKDTPHKNRLSRSGSGGGIMKTIGDLTTAVLTGPPNNNLVDEETGKIRTSSSRIEIVAFEIANIVVRVLNLRNSLRPADIKELKEEVLNSEGVRQLVSDDELDLWCIAAEDKRMELQAVAREVARLGALCPDSPHKFLTHQFNMLGTVEGPKQRLTTEEVEQELKYLETQAQVTAELYHELISLKSLEQAYQKKLHSTERTEDRDDRKVTGHQKDPLILLRSEVKTQEKHVKLLKKKGLWSKRVDVVVDTLVDIIIYLHDNIVDVFGEQVVKMGGLMDRPREFPVDMQKLGGSGLAMHYANIINVIDNLAMRPFAANQLRDTLYNMLSPSLRRQLKKALMRSRTMSHEETDVLVERVENVLDWLVTLGANTVRYSAERRLQGHTELTLLQTLHHANQRRTEALLVELLVRLNHVASRHRRQGEPERSPIPHGPIVAPIPDKRDGEGESEGESDVDDGSVKRVGSLSRGYPPGRLADLTPEDQKEEEEDDDDDLGEEWKTREWRGLKDHTNSKPYIVSGPEERNLFGSLKTLSEGSKNLLGIVGETPIPRSLSRHSLNSSKGSYSELDSASDVPSPSPSRSPKITTKDDVLQDAVAARTPPSIVAYRKLLTSLSEDDRSKIEKLAKVGLELPPGISKSLEFKRVGISGDQFTASGLIGKVYSSGASKSPLAYEATFLSPRSHSFSFTRSLLRSNSSTPTLGGDMSPRSRVRAMTPPAVDVDALGDEIPFN